MTFDWRTVRADMPWLLPSATIAFGVLGAGAVLTIFSGFHAQLPLVKFIAGWATIMAIFGFGGMIAMIIGMLVRGEGELIAALGSKMRAHRLQIASLAIGFFLAGILQLAFGWVKLQIPLLSPFWADPILADLDAAIFTVDPWIPIRKVIGIGIYFTDYVYSLWYPATLFSLFGVLVRPRNSALVLSYFMLWGIFGTITQALLSSAGPIFWDRLGYGNRFAAMWDQTPIGSRMASDYLFDIYVNGTNEIAGGISAMPSMHVAMAAWIALSTLGTKFAKLGIAYWAVVFVGSVALGWHYFLDGAVGTVGALACYMIARWFFRGEHRREDADAPGPEARPASL